METRHTNPQDVVSQDEGVLWMATNDPVTDHTQSPSVTCSERPQDETDVDPPAPAVIPQYYSVMDDECADDVFIPPPPPPYRAPSLPAEGSTDATVNNSCVTLTNGAADATEAKANPTGLDWHHGDKQLMAAHNEVDEVTANTTRTSQESMDPVSLSKDSTLPKDQDQTSMEESGRLMETRYDASERHHQDNTTGDDESNEEPEDVVILSGGQENWKESEAEGDTCPKQVPSSTEENSENETHFDKDGDIMKSKDICGLAETDSKLTTECVDGVATNAPTLSNLSVNDADCESCGPPELCKCTQNKMDAETNQPEIPTKVSNDDEEHVDTRSLNYNLTKSDWVRRESRTSETEVSQLPVCEASEETATKGEHEDGSRRIATDIQQGEQLLQRLQQVQLRQDVCTPESPHTSQEVVQETRGETKGVLGTEDDLKAREGDMRGGDEKEESRCHTVEDEGAKTNLMEKEKTEMSLSTMLVEPEHHTTARTEAGDSDDDQSDSWAPADLSPIDPLGTSSTQVPFPSTHHRFSAAETSIEKHIYEAAQEKQNLQRAGGVFNLADNPDVLEIPFKTNISLEPLATTAGPAQRSDWQFSEQKMHKEISQEIQRELVLVNQGKIPGGYSKGKVRQLKETKLLFEAFQQDNTEGPTRHRKPQTSLIKGHVYPSVLERTRSLEMFSLKSHRVSRAQSLKLYKSAELDKSPEDFRSKSPTSGSRDKTRLYPYPKQDKHVHLHRSMDSLSTEVSTSAVKKRSKSRDGSTTQESLVLEQNPFYKLRPALALQPEVEKDIREAREREEELRRQRCTLYGENWPNSEDKEESRFAPTLAPDFRQQSRGKLERVWPPPSKKDQMKDQTQQEPKVHRAGGQKAALWQRWESGLINGQPSKEKN